MKFPAQFRELSHRTNLMYVRPGRNRIKSIYLCVEFFFFFSFLFFAIACAAALLLNYAVDIFICQ